MALPGPVGPGGLLADGRHYLDVVAEQTSPILNNAFANQMHIMGYTPTPTQVYNNPTPAWDTLDWSNTAPARAPAAAPAPAPMAAPAPAPAPGNPYSGGGGGATQASNPYLDSIANYMAQRSQFALDNSMNRIRSNAVGVGGLGGSRQGVAEGVAAGLANQGLIGEMAGMYGNAYESDQNRSLQRYGIDTNAALGWAGVNNQRTAIDNQFYTAQRGQDLDAQKVGASLDLLNHQLQWMPIQNMASIYSTLANGNGTTTAGGSNGFDVGRFLADALATYQGVKNTWGR